MRFLSHIMILTASAILTWMVVMIVRDEQQARAERRTWDKCPMCQGAGRVPPLPEVIP